MAYKVILLEEARVELIEAAMFYKQFSDELSNIFKPGSSKNRSGCKRAFDISGQSERVP